MRVSNAMENAAALAGTLSSADVVKVSKGTAYSACSPSSLSSEVCEPGATATDTAGGEGDISDQVRAGM